MSLSFDPNTIELPIGHFIDGKFVNAKGHIELHRPSDGVAYAACPIAEATLVDEAVASAKKAARESGWATCAPRDRTRALHRWADLIEADFNVIGPLEAIASTRPIGQLKAGDIAVTAEQIRFFAEFADKECDDLVPTADSSFGMVMSEPYGVVGAITPWNVPISMAGWKLGPALAAGNAVVLKPSEMTPFSTLRMAQLAIEAGIPAGLFNVVLGDGPTTGTALTVHPDIGKVSFTGSTLAGGAIMQNIARTGIKPVTLELGGKSPQVVFEDADLETAANAIAASILSNAGQACVAGTRLIVSAKVQDELTERITKILARAEARPTWDETASFSPVISGMQMNRIDAIVRAAIADGAVCLTGGRQMTENGYYYAPTLLSEVSSQSPAIQQEIFGPVLTVQSFEDEAQALVLADHPTYGLAAGLFTRDLSRAIRVTRALQAGTVWVNRYGRSRDHILPTGGYKNSGIGKDLGREAFHANRRSKSVLIAIES